MVDTFRTAKPDECLTQVELSMIPIVSPDTMHLTWTNGLWNPAETMEHDHHMLYGETTILHSTGIKVDVDDPNKTLLEWGEQQENIKNHSDEKQDF